MTDCSTLQRQAASAHHCCDQEAQVQRAAVTSKSQEATASSCSFANTASPLSPVLSTSSSLTPGTNHQVLVHPWCCIPRHQEKAPNHSTSGRILFSPAWSLKGFIFILFLFFLPLSLFFFKEVPSISISLTVLTLQAAGKVGTAAMIVLRPFLTSFYYCKHSHYNVLAKTNTE